MNRIVLGVDPGTATTGFAVINAKGNRYSLQEYGVIKTSSKMEMVDRLKIIYNDLTKIISRHKVVEVAVEDIFFSKNVKTAITVAQARGVILLAAAKKNREVFSYKPNEVKLAVSGYGRASKGQVQEMVKRILKMDKIPRPDDAADAIAIALCHLNTYRSPK